jgi:acyl-CoA synthetase (AMP-forming)/AMP-acid ligase II
MTSAGGGFPASERSSASGHTAADFTLADFPEKAARWWGDRVAFTGSGTETTYSAFHDRVRRLAEVLGEAAVKEGTRVGLLSGNDQACFELFFACAVLGAVVVPFNVRLSPREIAYQRENADVDYAVVSPALSDLAERAGLTAVTHWWLGGTYDAAIADANPYPRRTVFPPDTPVSQMYTSGTTGFPKGCVQSQGGWRASALNLAFGLRLDRRAVALVQAPFFHAWGFGFILSHLYAGATAVFPPGTSGDDYWETIDRYQVTSASLPPSVPRNGLPRDQVTVVFGLAGGFRSSWKRLTEAFFPKAEYHGVYGMTELTNIAIMSRSWEEAENPGSMGEPLAGVQAEVHDEWGKPVGPGQIGELAIRAPQVCLGYYKDPEATAELFRGGWLRTGDLVLADDRGAIHFEDRAKDMIKTGGENVYSAEVERVLAEHPDVADVAVFGVPDKRWGEAVKAVVAPVPGADIDLAELDLYCIENIAAYKRPRWYEVIAELPRNATGKVPKAELRRKHDPATSIRLEERS